MTGCSEQTKLVLVSRATRAKLIRFRKSEELLRINKGGITHNEEGLAEATTAAANSSKVSCNAHLPPVSLRKETREDTFPLQRLISAFLFFFFCGLL